MQINAWYKRLVSFLQELTSIVLCLVFSVFIYFILQKEYQNLFSKYSAVHWNFSLRVLMTKWPRNAFGTCLSLLLIGLPSVDFCTKTITIKEFHALIYDTNSFILVVGKICNIFAALDGTQLTFWEVDESIFYTS